MRPPAVCHEALRLVADGVNDCEIARRLGVARTTVCDWRAPRYEPRSGIPRASCPRCWGPAKPATFTNADYALLLALYLGDGCISRMGRTYRLRIHLDTKYPHIIGETERLLERCFPFSAVSTLIKDKGSCAVPGVYGNHLPCRFPQHGPGKKHLRSLALEPWQSTIVEAEPWPLLKGLIWSDGCSVVNRHGKYEDLCFAFSKCSPDLLELFAGTCRRLGLAHRHYPTRQTRDRLVPGMIRINRREPVARLVEHVGIKR